LKGRHCKALARLAAQKWCIRLYATGCLSKGNRDRENAACCPS
jgi:hypothetical protein